MIEKLSDLIKGLTYISETDAEFLIYQEKNNDFGDQSFLSKAQETNIEDKKKNYVEERNFDDFFERLVKKQDWHADFEKKQVERYKELKNFLAENLRELKVYRIGKVNIEIYIVGLDEKNNLFGIKTKAVET